MRNHWGRRPSKAKRQTRHAIQRAYERYGVILKEDDVRHIANMIRRNQARSFWMQTNSRHFFEVSYAGHSMVAVYDNSRGTIRTFLPPLDGRTDEQYITDRQQYFEAEAA